MIRYAVIFSILLYALIAGCAFFSDAGEPSETGDRPPVGATTVPRKPTIARGERVIQMPMRGVAMQIQRVDWTETEYRASIDEVVALGADSIMFVFDAHQENAGSTGIYLDMRLMPTPEKIGGLIDYAKSKNLRVMIMPIVLLDRPRKYTEWRGTIQPESWEDWWRNYRAMLFQFSWIAELHKADVLVVGSELVSTESQTAAWGETITQVRENFKGMLTYSANWDHYRPVTFWQWLDFASMNSYYELGADNRVTVADIQQNWQPFKKKLLDFQEEIGKPIFFTEVGWCSQANAAKDPWDYTQDDVRIDLDLQERLWEGFFQTWHGTPGFGGFMLWEWPPGDGGPDNRGYTPEKKPAEKVIRDWLAKPAWQVK